MARDSPHLDGAIQHVRNPPLRGPTRAKKSLAASCPPEVPEIAAPNTADAAQAGPGLAFRRSLRSAESSLRCLTIEYTDRHILVAKLPTAVRILSAFQGLIKAFRRPPRQTKTGQHNPVMAAKGWAPMSLHLPDYEPLFHLGLKHGCKPLSCLHPYDPGAPGRCGCRSHLPEGGWRKSVEAYGRLQVW